MLSIPRIHSQSIKLYGLLVSLQYQEKYAFDLWRPSGILLTEHVHSASHMGVWIVYGYPPIWGVGILVVRRVLIAATLELSFLFLTALQTPVTALSGACRSLKKRFE